MTSEKVLIVDDEEYVRDSIAEIARGAGLEVVLASSCSQALEVLEAGPVQTVLTDLRMPGADGLEVLRRARAACPGLPVILMTAHASVATAIEAMKLGAVDYVEKPFDNDELRALVRRGLEHSRLARENRSLRGALRGRHGFEAIVAACM